MSSIILPLCTYNNSLNKYFFYGNLDNITVDLDSFSFFNLYNRRLSFIKERFISLFCTLSSSSPKAIQKYGLLSPTNPKHLFAFANFILDARVNPFISEWEVTLANWPQFQGTSLLDCCRTQYEIRRESEEALQAVRAEKATAFQAEVDSLISQGALPKYASGFAQKIWSAGKDQKKVRGTIVSKIAVANKLGRQARSAKALAEAKMEVLFEPSPTPAQIQMAAEASSFSCKLNERYAERVKYWRQRRAAAREARAFALYRETADLLSASLLPPTEKVEMLRKYWRPRQICKEATPTVVSVVESMAPYMGLGAKSADVRCWAICQTSKIAGKFPALSTAICSWVLGTSRSFEIAEPIRKFIGNLTFLVDFYPEEALVKELDNITTEAECFKAGLVTDEERQKLQAYADESNVKGNLFYKVASKIKGMAVSARNSFYNGCETAGRRVSEGIFSVMVGHFRECLGMLKYELHSAMQLIEVFIARAKVWYENLIKKLDDTLAALGTFSMYALAILLGVGLATLIENCCGGKGTLTGIFVTAAFAMVGLQYSVGWENIQREMVQMCTVLARSMFGTESRANTHGLGSNVKSIPILSSVVSAMTTFGTGLCAMNSASIIEIGKLGAACHSIRMGKEALKEFAGTMIHYLGRLADQITGRETVFFDELSTLVSVDVRGWIRNAQGCILESFHTEVGNSEFTDRVSRLVASGHKLQEGINGVPRKISTDYAMLVGQIMKDLMELHKRSIRCGTTTGRRKEPVWIYLFGQTHCGKSNYMSELDNKLAKHFDLPNTVAYRNCKDDFHSGYNGQTFFHMDDLSAIVTTPPVEGELINLVSSQEVPLNMADLADKPIYFRSPFVITSSNQIDIPAAAGIRDTESYRSRKACLVEMRRKPGVVYDPDSPLEASQARFLDPMAQTIIGASEQNREMWLDMDDVTTEIINISMRHRSAQDKLQARFMRERTLADPVLLAAEEFLKGDAKSHYLRLTSLSLEKVGIKDKDFAMGLYADETLYLLDGQFKFKIYPIKDPEMCKHLAERMRNSFLPQIQKSGYLQSQSMVVSGFLRSLVNEQCAVLDVETLSSGATDCQKRIFQNLRLEERVYLRALQLAIDSYVLDLPENPYANTAWMKLLSTIGSGRQFLMDHGCGVLMLAAALLAVIVCGWGFWKLVVALFTGSLSLSTAVGGMAAVDTKAQFNSSGLEKGYRSRNIPVQHRYAYARSQAGDGLLPAAKLCVAIYQPGGGFVSAMQYLNKSVRLTRHQALRFKEGEQLTCIFASTGMTQLVRWHRYHMHEEPNSEIVTWLAPSLPALSPDLKNLFLENRETELPNYFKTMGYVLRQDAKAFHYDTLDSVATVDKTPLPLKGVMGEELYLHEIPEKIVFHYESRNDDCGMLITCQIGGRMKVVGMLVAGKDKTSWADIMPPCSLAEIRSQIEYVPDFGEAEDGYFKAGYVNIQDAPVLPKKTNMAPVPEHLRVPCDVPIKEPSVLHKEDVRCPEGVDPPRTALKKKFTQPMLELEQEILDEVAMDILETWYDAEDHVLEDIPLSVAINGIPAGGEEEQLENFIMKTSPGYPYFKHNRETHQKGKHPYFEEDVDGSLKIKEGSMAAELHENLVEFTKTEVPELVVIECPKDELLPARKIKVGACRLFEIMPLHYNLFLRQKTCAFTKFLQRNRHRLPCQVGTNAYSREWGHLLNRLMRVKTTEAINCDYSGFDGLLTPQLIECMARMINRLYALSGESEVSQAQRFNMLMALTGRYALVGQQVFMVNCGLPSGFALTVIMNSVFNEILIRYAYKKLAPQPQRNLFGVSVCLLVYGDDNLISVSPTASSWFTGEAIRICLAEKKIKITDGSDKDAPTIMAKPFSQLDFLKRKFLRLQNGIVQAPLDRSAIFSSLYWLTPDKSKLGMNHKPEDLASVDTIEELLINVNVALVELYLHDDREEFDRVRNFYTTRLPIMVEKFRTWAFCESFHSAQQTGMLHYDPAKVLDTLVGPGFAKFMRTSGEGKNAHFYSPVLGVCGPYYKPETNDFIISTLPLNMGVSGEHVPIEIGEGVGSLPTKRWVQNFGKPSKLKNKDGYCIYNLLAEMIEAGKRLIFMSPAPYVAGNAALISYGASRKLIIEKDALAHYRNVIPEKLDGLERYFDAPVPTANIGQFYFANGQTYAALCEFKDAKVLNLDALPTQMLNEACRQRKVPCMAANNVGHRFMVAMVCDNSMCIHHRATGRNYEDAFRMCWKQRCKTKRNQVDTWYGTKLS